MRDRTLLYRALLSGRQGNILQISKYNIQIGRAAGLAIGDGARVEGDDDLS